MLHVTVMLCAFLAVVGAKIGHAPVDMIPIAVAPPSAHLDSISIGARELFERVDAAAPIVPFGSLVRTVVLEDGEGNDEFSLSFMPETGRNLSDYVASVECQSHDVLREEDVVVAPPVLMVGDRVNYTVSIPFERQVGQADVVILFRRHDRSLYASVTVRYLVCGISFFAVDRRTSKRTFVANNEFTVESFRKLDEDGLLVFYTLIQFPDGSTSETVAAKREALPDLSSMQTTIGGDKLLASQSFEACLTGNTKKYPNGTISLSESCSFGFTPMTASEPLYLSIRLLRYRTGVVEIRFRWDEFTKSTIAGEVYETSLKIRVLGTVPASVVSIAPAGPFRRSGGQLLECVVINDSPEYIYHFTIGNVTISPSTRMGAAPRRAVLSFVTPRGEGQNVPWDLSYSTKDSNEQTSCVWAGESGRFVFTYLDEDIYIKSLSPKYGPIAGGTLVTCNGYFGGFNASSGSGDVIVLGSYFLEKKFIVSVTKTSLVFTIPSKEEVQSTHFELECFVIVHGIRSNSVKFTFESLTAVTIDITGSSYEEKNNTFMVPMCGSGTVGSENQSISLFADVNKGASLFALTFEWRVVVLSTRAEITTALGSSEAQSLSISLSKFSTLETYEVLVVASDERFSTRLRASIQIQPTKLKRLGIGLSIDHSRTISLPPVDTRVTASVTDLGECHMRSKTLSYDWTYMSVTRTLTSTSKEVDVRNPSPRRLGREYIIPSNQLVYGKHKITVKVYYTDDPSTYGTATTWLNVEPAPLQAVIGGGESFVRVSSSQDLEITAKLSYDPDDASSNRRKKLSYQWQCEMSMGNGAKFTTVTSCPARFLPQTDNEGFILSSDTLNSVRYVNGTTHIKYYLIVLKHYKKLGIRASSRTSQIVEVVHTDELFAGRGIVSLTGSDGRSVLARNVPYYDDFVMSVSGQVGSAWRFRLREPATESYSFLQNPSNLILTPAFYRPNDFIAGKQALGIRGGALSPGTEYRFEVQYESRNADSTTITEISIRTMPKATVAFLPMARTTGSTRTVFSAIASPSHDHYKFKYYFYIKMEDGSEMCIDGCSGQRKVSFRVPMAGKHTIRCTMVDARGKTVIHEAPQHQIVSIHDHAVGEMGLMIQSEALSRSFDIGDHSVFAMESVNLARYASSINPNDTLKSEMVTELVSVTVDKLAQMYLKTQPNTVLAKDYVQIVEAFSAVSVGIEVMGNIDTLFNLCKMLYYAVLNTPTTERFDMTRILSKTLTQLVEHAKQVQVGGSTRRRLAAMRMIDVEGVNDVLLAVYEVVVPLVVEVLTRAEPCGFVETVNMTGVGEVRGMVSCNKEQALTLAGRHARLEWCEGVYGNEAGVERVEVGLGELRDYIAESGVLSMREAGNGRRGDEVDTRNMASQGYVITKTMMRGGDGTGGGACFRVVQTARAAADVLGPDVECSRVGAVEYRETQGLERGMKKGMYEERVLESRVLEGKMNRERVSEDEVGVVARMGSVNRRTFGVKRLGCRDLKPVILGEVKGMWMGPVAVLGVMAGVLALGMIGMMKMNRDAEVLVVDGGDGPYIERDVYGRGHGNIGDREVEVGDGDGEEMVVFENASPRIIGGVLADGQKASELFGSGDRS